MDKILIKNAVKREIGYVYYIDGLGNVCRTKLADVDGHPKSNLEKGKITLEEFESEFTPKEIKFIKKYIDFKKVRYIEFTKTDKDLNLNVLALLLSSTIYEPKKFEGLFVLGEINEFLNTAGSQNVAFILFSRYSEKKAGKVYGFSYSSDNPNPLTDGLNKIVEILKKHE
jgi:hypothetical protein